MIRIKADVRIRVYSRPIQVMLECLMEMDRITDRPTDIVITSIYRKPTTKPSRHSTHEAVDVRSWSFPSFRSKMEFRQRLDWLLNYPNKQYTVIYEPTLHYANGKVKRTEHFHAQVKKGVTHV